mmetsp:Transcript_66324/g.154075  ORF Transcript_66324/g.154075 Transcript_66324/m.154075 type:complete len:409 (-) Transcript_66324:125-1351(-)
MSEFAKADKMVERFLGIRSGHLCPQFNFNHNTQPMLIFEVITSSLILQAIFFGARWMNSKLHPEDTERENVDGSLQDLDQFSTMVDKTLTSMTQLQTQALSTQQTANRSALESYRQERPRDLQRLRDEFQQKISAVKNKWQNEPEDPGPLDETTDFHVTAALAVLYWALQAILSCTVLCCIGVSMISIADGGVWPHYCLLMYAVSNCGMLPTACQALVFLADWFFFEAIVSAPARLGATQQQPSVPSYQPLEQTSPRRSDSARRRQEEVNDMKPKFAILCMPELVALGFMVTTHTIPFMFMFLWMTLLILVVGYLVVRLVQRFVKTMWPDPRRRALHQMQIFALLFYMFLALYVHASVQVMTRVYAGEWRHGGYFDSLWWHLIIDTADLAPCPWFTFVRVVDFPLRWT